MPEYESKGGGPSYPPPFFTLRFSYPGPSGQNLHISSSESIKLLLDGNYTFSYGISYQVRTAVDIQFLHNLFPMPQHSFDTDE